MTERLSDEDVATYASLPTDPEKVVLSDEASSIWRRHMASVALAREVQERRAAETKPRPQCEENARWIRLGQAWMAQHEADVTGASDPTNHAVARWMAYRDKFEAAYDAVLAAKATDRDTKEEDE